MKNEREDFKAMIKNLIPRDIEAIFKACQWILDNKDKTNGKI